MLLLLFYVAAGEKSRSGLFPSMVDLVNVAALNPKPLLTSHEQSLRASGPGGLGRTAVSVNTGALITCAIWGGGGFLIISIV